MQRNASRTQPEADPDLEQVKKDKIEVWVPDNMKLSDVLLLGPGFGAQGAFCFLCPPSLVLSGGMQMVLGWASCLPEKSCPPRLEGVANTLW